MIDHWLQSLMPAIQHLSGWIYWVALLAALVETLLVVGLFLPGSTLLLLLGALASASGGPSFAGILAFAVVGAVLGDNINYHLGRRYGQRWRDSGIWLLRREHFDKAHAFFARHGGKSVFLARFIPSLKEVAPFLAGTAGMPRRWFFLWNLLGAIGWGLQWVGAGYLFARSLVLAQQWISRTGLGLGLLVLLLFLLWYLRRTMLRHGPDWWATAASVMRTLIRAVRATPEVQAAVARHPRLFGVLAARLDRRRFQGLPLTLLATAFCYLLLLFGGLIEDLITADPIVALDHSVAEMIAALRTPGWVTASAWVSHLGNWQVVVAILLAAGAWLWLSRRRAYLLPLLLSVGGSTLFAFAGKLAMHRTRPADATIHAASYAFPSGHATIAVSLFGFLAYVWMREIRHWPARVNLLFAWAFLALALGASRLVLDVHFLSDILGGYLLGGMWLVVAIGWTEWTLARSTHAPVRHQPVVLSGAIILVAAAFIATAYLYPPHRLPAPGHGEQATRQLPQDTARFLQARLPHYVHTALGSREQPLSIALLAGNARQLGAVMQADGWQKANPPDAHALLYLARKGLNDLKAPSVPLFWNGNLYTLAFNRNAPSARHPKVLTMVLWSTPYRDTDGRHLWTGIVRAYSGTHWYRARRLLPDLDAARNEALTGLQRHGCIKDTRTLNWVAPQVGQTFIQDRFFTRGKLQLATVSNRCSGP